jgi:hypothetical protein
MLMMMMMMIETDGYSRNCEHSLMVSMLEKAHDFYIFTHFRHILVPKITHNQFHLLSKIARIRTLLNFTSCYIVLYRFLLFLDLVLAS